MAEKKILEEITLGEATCIKIKNIYYSEIAWPLCYKEVAKKFSELKVKAMKFYGDKSKLEVLKELLKFSDEDIQDMFTT